MSNNNFSNIAHNKCKTFKVYIQAQRSPEKSRIVLAVHQSPRNDQPETE